MKALMQAISLALSAITIVFALATTAQAQDAGAVCWKPSYGRGAGTLTNDCAVGEREAGLCYNTACPAGWTGVGPACHQNCPAGYGSATAADISCRKPAPASRVPYPNTAPGIAQCNKESGGLGCEVVANMQYIKPIAGWVCAGPACRPACPADMNDQGLFCGKQAARGRGVGVVPKCADASSAQAGLCYKSCNPGFGGAGPVCWGQCPATHQVDCGAMCGTHSSQCAAAVANQVISVLDVVATTVETVVTFGGSTAVRAGISTAKTAAQESITAAAESITVAAKATVKAVTKDQVRTLLIKQFKEAGVALTESQLTNLVAVSTGDKFDFTTLDPTGIAAVVQAFNKPICAVRPEANIPVVANPAFAGQIFRTEPEQNSWYLISTAGTKHKLHDNRFPLAELARVCNIIGKGDILPIGLRVMPGPGWAGLQPAEGAVKLPRGKDINLEECQAMRTSLQAVGKWKFLPTP